MTLATIFHLLGAVIGMGGAFASDLIFFSSIRDEKVSRTEMRFLRLGGKMVWLGLAIIVASGIALVAENPERYLASPKFLAKMTIVAVLIVNGVLFHLVHIPRLERHAGTHFPSSDEFVRNVPILLASGAISTVSWLGAFVLGAAGGLDYPYIVFVGAYLSVLAIAIGAVLFFKKRLIPHLR
jgi:hypothetical protein